MSHPSATLSRLPATPVTEFRFSTRARSWEGSHKTYRIERQQLDEGAHRRVFRAWKDDSDEELVVKYFKKRVRQEAYFDESMMQTLSGQIARKFNKQVAGTSLRFLPSWIIRIDDGEFAFVEPYVAGDDFVKYNDNNGEVLYQDPVMQAFSHFSWQNSGGQILICDLQGWGQTLTDPQIHTIDGKGFGQGNMGEDGIQNFFDSHRCNRCCRSLGLVDGGKSHPLTRQTKEPLTNQKEEEKVAPAPDVLPANAQAKTSALWSMLRSFAKSASTPFSTSPDSSRGSSPLASRAASRTSSSCSGNAKRVLAPPPPHQDESSTTARSRRQTEESSLSAEDNFARPQPERRPSLWVKIPSMEDVFAQPRKERRPSFFKVSSAEDILASPQPERKPTLWRVQASGSAARENLGLRDEKPLPLQQRI